MTDNNDNPGIRDIIPLEQTGAFLLEQIKKIPGEVQEINSALLELAEASDSSLSSVEKHFDAIAAGAEKLGVSVSDAVRATASWSRAGYSLPDSAELAEAALLYRNTTEGTDTDSAVQLISGILQEYGLETRDAMSVVDQLHALSKDLPGGGSALAETFLASAPTLHAAGADLAESLALAAGAARILADTSTSENMWDTISPQLTGTQSEGIYSTITGTGAEWSRLTGTQQDGLLESLAGSGQQDSLRAILENVSVIEEAYHTARESSGSALEAQQIYEQGVQYSLDRLGTSFQTFAAHILDSGFLKGIADLGNSAIHTLDTVTGRLESAGTAGLGIGLLAGIKNAGKCRTSVRIS